MRTVHAQTLLRTASPKLRERALLIERNAEDSADITLKLLQAKDARVFDSRAKEKFLLNQLPDDHYVSVDSHSASPAFADDARELAFALNRAGAAGPVELIMLTASADGGCVDRSLAAEKREAAQAKFMQGASRFGDEAAAREENTGGDIRHSHHRGHPRVRHATRMRSALSLPAENVHAGRLAVWFYGRVIRGDLLDAQIDNLMSKKTG